MQPKITVIIPTFNRSMYIVECLESIISQTLQPHQIIVVNDGSSDQTRDILKSYYPAVDYLETNQEGKSAAVNAGLERVRGDYVWIFDDDDVALPHALEYFSTPLEKYPEYGYSYSSFYYAGTRYEDNHIGQVTGEFIFPDIQKRGPLIPLLESNYLCGAGLFVRKECFSTVGLYNPVLVRSEDYEFAIRIVRQFKGIHVTEGPTFYYRQHDGLRGSLANRFGVEDRHKKWLEYDQIIFRRLYHELPLEDYLPPGKNLETFKRQAHLQRLAVLASKFLYGELIKELQLFAQLPDTPPLTDEEREIIRNIIMKPAAYKTGNIYEYDPFFDQIRRLAPTFRSAHQLRAEILRAIIIRLTKKHRWLQPRQVYGAMLKAIRLYL